MKPNTLTSRTSASSPRLYFITDVLDRHKYHDDHDRVTELTVGELRALCSDALRVTPSENGAILAPHYTMAEVRKLFDEWVMEPGNARPFHNFSFDAYHAGFVKAQCLDVQAAQDAARKATLAERAGST